MNHLRSYRHRRQIEQILSGVFLGVFFQLLEDISHLIALSEKSGNIIRYSNKQFYNDDETIGVVVE